MSKTFGAGGPFGNSNDVVVAPAGAGVFLNFAWLNFFPDPPGRAGKDRKTIGLPVRRMLRSCDRNPDGLRMRQRVIWKSERESKLFRR